MPEIKCSSCGNTVEGKECYELYVGMGHSQYICPTCQRLPFSVVMKHLENGKNYIIGSFKTIEELKKS